MKVALFLCVLMNFAGSSPSAIISSEDARTGGYCVERLRSNIANLSSFVDEAIIYETLCILGLLFLASSVSACRRLRNRDLIGFVSLYGNFISSSLF